MIGVKQLSLARNHKLICDDLNLTIHPGERWVILGPNGCGKTTLLHALAGCYPPMQGEIIIRGKRLNDYPRKAIARMLALLQQDFTPTFPQSVYEYCEASRFPHLSYFERPTSKDKQIIQDALERMDLLPFKETNLLHLSGGEKQRLSIAAVLAQTPDIFLLDEPTNHLDIRHQIHCLAHFTHLTQTSSNTLIFTSHDINHAQQFGTHALLLFGNGETLSGPVDCVLNTEHLSRLFNHKMHRVESSERTVWVAGAHIVDPITLML